HQLLIIAMGTPMFDNCDLEALSEAAATRYRWAFLLTAAPLAVAKGAGSPLNPIEKADNALIVCCWAKDGADTCWKVGYPRIKYHQSSHDTIRSVYRRARP